MERTTFSILFYIKRSKLLKNGDAPVYVRITINGVSDEVSLKRSIEPKLWDTKRNKAKGSSEEARQLNDYLNSVRGQIFYHHQQMQEKGKTITAKLLKNTFLGIGEKQWTLVELFAEHNNEMRNLIGREYAPLTLQRYNAALKHLRIFMKQQYNQDDLPLTEINHKFISGFEFYLKSKAKCQHNSAMKHVKALKKIIRIALANDYIRKDPFSNYRITQKPVDIGYLTENEIRRLIEREIPIERIAVVRDLFVFQIFSGLAYGDIKNLTADNIDIGIDGLKWIFIKRGKTKNPCRVPLLAPAQEILDKYSNHPFCQTSGKLLPVLSDQKMNAYLKEIADLCGIKKKLHTHLARHTFATTVALSNGVPMETVSHMMGHRKLATTHQVYARVLDKKISEDMEKVQKWLDAV
ncbi:MAG: recombinase [Bacteroidetes bacterium]|nr:MAG: recombinase [Bacteroidota bacterium]